MRGSVDVLSMPNTTTADGGNVSIGAKADAAATDSTSSWSLIALFKGVYALLASTAAVLIRRSDTYAARITTNTTTAVRNSAGTCIGFIVNSIGTTEVVDIYDAVNSAAGTAVVSITLTSRLPGDRITVDLAFGTGITFKTSGAGACDITPIHGS